MQSGSLRNKVNIYSYDGSTNTFGEVELTAALLGEYYCSVKAYPQTEVEEGTALLSIVKYDLRFRYYSALETLDKSAYIMLGTTRLEILAISNVKNENKQLHFICEARS